MSSKITKRPMGVALRAWLEQVWNLVPTACGTGLEHHTKTPIEPHDPLLNAFD